MAHEVYQFVHQYEYRPVLRDKSLDHVTTWSDHLPLMLRQYGAGTRTSKWNAPRRASDGRPIASTTSGGGVKLRTHGGCDGGTGHVVDSSDL
jgi:hypothetical protein